ncbi:hypothetical protein N7491_008519 [Penicillium cf. griseofulvum]|nr:hypothetical protein N7491_008519 [Penicillium cf. griseofulvum]
MEVAGVTLAVLPLLLNQLDNYVQGLETLKGFRAKRYLRELEGYYTSLDTQQTIFVNHLLRSLEGVVVYEDGIDDLNNHALGDLWKKEALHSALRNKLGRNFQPFMQTMKEISDLLEDLSLKLQWDDNASVEKYWNHTPSIEREIKKFRDIFSKSIYSNLFARLNAANKTLGTLLKQTEYQFVTRKQRNLKIPLSRQKKSSKVRSQPSQYNSPWQMLEVFLQRPTLGVLCAEISLYGKHEWTKPNLTTVSGYGHEVEAQSDPIQSDTESRVQEASQTYCTESIHAKKNNKKKMKVQFAIPKSTQDVPSSPDPLQVSPISDICVALSTATTSGEQYKLLGYLPDDYYRHNIYHLQTKAENLKSQSLAEIIVTSSNHQGPLSDSFIFTQKHRLHLAVNLACSVLQFHGSWLKTQWSARDIMFTANMSDIDNPYVLWKVASETDSRAMGIRRDSASLIRSEILFPLGLVLVELSLCRTLESLRIPEDLDQIEAYTDLKTAARHLPIVEMQSGVEYGKVVERCLFWSGIKESSLDNERMQDEVFQLIIFPLVDHLNTFEGKARMY